MADMARVREGLRLHRREGDLFIADLEALTPDQWEIPTNCPPWLVRTLAAHVARQRKDDVRQSHARKRARKRSVEEGRRRLQ